MRRPAHVDASNVDMKNYVGMKKIQTKFMKLQTFFIT